MLSVPIRGAVMWVMSLERLITHDLTNHFTTITSKLAAVEDSHIRGDILTSLRFLEHSANVIVGIAISADAVPVESFISEKTFGVIFEDSGIKITVHPDYPSRKLAGVQVSPRFGLTIIELIRNAIKHGRPAGTESLSIEFLCYPDPVKIVCRHRMAEALLPEAGQLNAGIGITEVTRQLRSEAPHWEVRHELATEEEGGPWFTAILERKGG